MRIWSILPMALVAVVCSGCGQERPPPITEAEWQKRVIDDPGPVLVDFGATWCGPCRTMDPIIARLAKDFKVVKVDVDANEDLAMRMKIETIPAFFIFVNGKVITSFQQGIVRESVLRNELKQLSR
jgi:thioredoxin